MLTDEPLPEDCKILLSLVRAHPGMDMKAIPKETGFDQWQARYAVELLLSLGLVKVKLGPGGVFKYCLFPE